MVLLAVRRGAVVNGTVHGPAAAAPPREAAAGHLMTGVVLPLVTAAVALAGLRVHVPGGRSALDAVAVGLVLVWALAGAICARAADRVPQWPRARGRHAWYTRRPRRMRPRSANRDCERSAGDRSPVRPA